MRRNMDAVLCPTSPPFDTQRTVDLLQYEAAFFVGRIGSRL
jgi:hypothetical protein